MAIKKKNYELAYNDYKTGDYTYDDIAKKYKVTKSAVQAWQKRYWRQWDNDGQNNNVQSNIQNGHGGSEWAGDVQGNVQGQAIRLDMTKVNNDSDVSPDIVMPIKRDVSDIDVKMAMADDVYNSLEPRQRAFIDEYIVNGRNGINAYLKVYKCSYGAAGSSSSELLRNPKVAHVLEVKLAERAAEAHTDLEYLLMSAKTTVARCMQAAPVMTFNKQTKQYEQVKDDDGANVWQFDSKGAIAGLELIAKLTGQLINKTQVDVTTKVETMSEEDRKKRILELQKDLGINTINITPNV